MLGFFAFSVARRQAAIAAAILQFRLYERRLRVYTSIRRFLLDVKQHTASDDEEAVRPIPDVDMTEAFFLFDEEVQGFLHEVEKRSRYYRQDLRSQVKFEEEGRRDALASAEAALEENYAWISDAVESLDDRFAPYLRFTRMKGSLAGVANRAGGSNIYR